MSSTFGVRGPVPDDSVFATDDHSVAELVIAGVRNVLLEGGDLGRSLGINAPPPERGGQCVLCAVDVIDIRAISAAGDDRRFVAASTLSFGRWGSGVDFITSTGFLDGLEICPRSHPGDGMLDRLAVAPGLSFRRRVAIRRRMRSGSHLPHPALSVFRSTAFILRGPRKLTVDGVPRGVFTELQCNVRPSALVIAIPLGMD